MFRDFFLSFAVLGVLRVSILVGQKLKFTILLPFLKLLEIVDRFLVFYYFFFVFFTFYYFFLGFLVFFTFFWAFFRFIIFFCCGFLFL